MRLNDPFRVELIPEFPEQQWVFVEEHSEEEQCEQQRSPHADSHELGLGTQQVQGFSHPNGVGREHHSVEAEFSLAARTVPLQPFVFASEFEAVHEPKDEREKKGENDERRSHVVVFEEGRLQTQRVEPAAH